MSGVDKLPNFSVKVANGSGCLIQPATTKYSYVLTAKHIIKDQTTLSIIRQIFNSEKGLINYNLEIIETPYNHKDPEKDAAIIKVKLLEDLYTLSRITDIFRNDISWYLTGHPTVRGSEDFSYRHNKLTMAHVKKNGYVEAEVNKVIIHSEINGQSGGGIIGIADDKYFLAGIQTRMSMPDDKETLSRIDFMPLSFFDEIIKEHKEDLSELTQLNKKEDLISDNKIVEIFYSYSEKDSKLLNRIEEQLPLLRRRGIIKEWHKGKSQIGKDQKEQIDLHLNSAQIILLLISNNFLNSDDCYAQMERAMERHETGEARVVPIILRRCEWRDLPIAKLSILPQGERPATDWTNKDEGFYNIGKGIRAVIEEFKV